MTPHPAEGPITPRGTGLETLDTLPIVPHMESVRPLNRAAPARLAASLRREGSFPALPLPPDVTSVDGVDLEYDSDSSRDDDDMEILHTISMLEHLPSEKRKAELRRLAAEADDDIAKGDLKAAERALAVAEELEKIDCLVTR